MLQSQKLMKEKEDLIRVWMDLQDQAEGLNEQVYVVTCEIESLNLRIQEALAREAHEAGKKKGGKGPPANGKQRAI